MYKYVLSLSRTISTLNNVLYRFCYIIDISISESKTAHIQWMEHSSDRLEEAHHPHELFFLSSCDFIDLCSFQKKINVHLVDNPIEPPALNHQGLSDEVEYFVRYCGMISIYRETMPNRFWIDFGSLCIDFAPVLASIPVTCCFSFP